MVPLPSPAERLPLETQRPHRASTVYAPYRAAHIGSPRRHVEHGTCDEIDMSRPSICMKMGHADWSPNQHKVGDTRWKCQASGDGWAVWEDVRHCH